MLRHQLLLGARFAITQAAAGHPAGLNYHKVQEESMPSKNSITYECVRSKQAVKRRMHTHACIYKDHTQPKQNSKRISVDFLRMMQDWHDSPPM